MSRRAQSQPPKMPQQANRQLSVQVTVTTWVKDSHGLFDYQANPQHLKTQTIYLENECRIFRNPQKNETIVHKNPQARRITKENVQIGTLSIDRSKGAPRYKLKTAKRHKHSLHRLRTQPGEDLDIQPFSVVKDFVNENGIPGFPLQPGNIIKLGRIQFMVIELNDNHAVRALRDTVYFEQTNGIFDATQAGSTIQEENCKICLCNDTDLQNPLISPCKCKGSCSLIHVSCLQTWINSKVKRDIHGIVTSYNFTKFECEICKNPFPQFIKLQNIQIEMMKIVKPKKPYIILESLFSRNQAKQQKCLHLISANQIPVRIGRGHGNDIRIQDISVSRSHAEIFFNNQRFFIKDLDSKFGSLVKFNDQCQIDQQKPFKIQLGRTLLQFKVMREPTEVDTEDLPNQ